MVSLDFYSGRNIKWILWIQKPFVQSTDQSDYSDEYLSSRQYLHESYVNEKQKVILDLDCCIKLQQMIWI